MADILVEKELKGLLCICSYCKRIRGNGKQWEQLEHYITEHSEAEFSHGVCPECKENILKPKLRQLIHSRPRPTTAATKRGRTTRSAKEEK